MAITEFVSVRDERSTIAVFEEPPAAAENVLPEYKFSRVSRETTSWIQSSEVAAVLFIQSPTNANQITKDLTDFAPLLLQQGCPVFIAPVVAHPNQVPFRHLIDAAINRVQLPSSSSQLNDRELVALTPCVHVLETQEWWNELARAVRNNRRGPSANSALRIEVVDSIGSAISLSDEQLLLVQRAFYDCHTVHLRELTNGISGVRAYKTHAWLSESQVGSRWPTKLFVKLGGRPKISKEFRAFTSLAVDSIAYHLGPRVVRERSALGHADGILVSDYVSGAETLRDVCRDSRGSAAIAHLFEITLEPWRMNATQDLRALKRELREGRYQVPIFRRARIEKHTSITELYSKLDNALAGNDSESVLVGVVHGDLHATNVMVRGGDSIVIDLEQLRIGQPLLFDVANVEAGLFVDGFVDDRRRADLVLKSIQPLYSKTSLNYSIAPWNAHDASAWYFQCVRQIRMHARQMEERPLQYALILACAFVKKACNPQNFDNLSKVSTSTVPPTSVTNARPSAPTQEDGERTIAAQTSSDSQTCGERLTKEDVRALSMRVAFEILAALGTTS